MAQRRSEAVKQVLFVYVLVKQYFSIWFLEWRPGKIKNQSATQIGTRFKYGTLIAGEKYYKFTYESITVGTYRNLKKTPVLSKLKQLIS